MFTFLISSLLAGSSSVIVKPYDDIIEGFEEIGFFG